MSLGEQLYDAAKSGDVEAVERLLDEGADIEYRVYVSEVVMLYQAMDHEEILGAIDQGASYWSRSKLYGSGTKRWINEQ